MNRVVLHLVQNLEVTYVQAIKIYFQPIPAYKYQYFAGSFNSLFPVICLCENKESQQSH